jgi:hypothetical protein
MKFEISSIHPRHYTSHFRGKENYNYKRVPVEGTAIGMRNSIRDIGTLIQKAEEDMFSNASKYDGVENTIVGVKSPTINFKNSEIFVVLSGIAMIRESKKA